MSPHIAEVNDSAGLPESGDRFWDLYSTFYDAIYQLMPYRKLLWDTYQALDLSDGLRVLDAGCGSGNFEYFIHTKDCPSVEIDAIDFSESMLSAASRKCRDLDNVTFSRHDLSQPLPFGDATFDRIVTINVLYAVPDAEFVISELLRVLKPNGQIVITSPSPEFAVRVIVADHFARLKNIWGLRRQVTAAIVTTTILITRGMGGWFLNQFVINKREAAGEYNSLDGEALEALLGRYVGGGLASFDVSRALVDQNIFATGLKAATAA